MRLDLSTESIAAACAGDREQIERLLEDAWPHAYRIAFSILRDPELAKDTAQDACASVLTGIGSLRSPQAFRVWFYRIVVRAATHAVRGMQPQPLHERTPAAHADTAQRIDLQSALGELSPVQRTAVVLHYYAGLNSSEIGGITGVPSATVRFRLAMAKRRLRGLLEERVAHQPNVLKGVSL